MNLNTLLKCIYCVARSLLILVIHENVSGSAEVFTLARFGGEI